MKKILLLLLLGLLTFVLSYCEIGVQPKGHKRGYRKNRPVYKEHPKKRQYKRRHKKERWKKRKKRRRHRNDDYDDD